MKLFLSIKYHPNQSNRERIEQILAALEKNGNQATCIVRDIEAWGTIHYDPRELMQITFREIRGSQRVVIDLTEKGVGVGIEAGYATARGIEVITIAQAGCEVSTTLAGISNRVLYYDHPDELEQLLDPS
jgi:hypothetical protein